VKPAWHFAKTTIIGGLLFLLPLVAIVYLLGAALLYTHRIVRPIVRIMPFDSFAGMAMEDVLGVVLLVVVAFLAGLVARTGVGVRMVERTEHLILRRIPGYTLYKSMARPDSADAAGVSVALAHIDEAWMLAFVMDKHDNGMLTVFVPSAPTPAAGAIYFLREDQIRRLDVPVSAAVRCVTSLGVGSRNLLAGKIPAGKIGT
jgi:uncharacterized membrane protein